MDFAHYCNGEMQWFGVYVSMHLALAFTPSLLTLMLSPIIARSPDWQIMELSCSPCILLQSLVMAQRECRACLVRISFKTYFGSAGGGS